MVEPEGMTEALGMEIFWGNWSFRIAHEDGDPAWPLLEFKVGSTFLSFPLTLEHQAYLTREMAKCRTA